jgi:hypothetical protein
LGSFPKGREFKSRPRNHFLSITEVSRLPVTFVRIVNPKVPGGTLVLAWQDFDPTRHTLYVAPADSTSPEPADSETTDPTAQESVAPTQESVAPTQDIVAPAAATKSTRVRKPKPTSTTETA